MRLSEKSPLSRGINSGKDLKYLITDVHTQFISAYDANASLQLIIPYQGISIRRMFVPYVPTTTLSYLQGTVNKGAKWTLPILDPGSFINQNNPLFKADARLQKQWTFAPGTLRFDNWEEKQITNIIWDDANQCFQDHSYWEITLLFTWLNFISDRVYNDPNDWDYHMNDNDVVLDAVPDYKWFKTSPITHNHYLGLPADKITSKFKNLKLAVGRDTDQIPLGFYPIGAHQDSWLWNTEVLGPLWRPYPYAEDKTDTLAAQHFAISGDTGFQHGFDALFDIDAYQ